MGEFIRLCCPAEIKPYAYHQADGKIESARYCNALLKIYLEPAEFTEILVCPRCHAHWRIVKKLNGAAKAMRIGKELKVNTRGRLQMVVVGDGDMEIKHAEPCAG